MKNLFRATLFILMITPRVFAGVCSDIDSDDWMAGLEDTLIQSSNTVCSPASSPYDTITPINQSKIPFSTSTFGDKTPNDWIDAGYDTPVKPSRVVENGSKVNILVYDANLNGSISGAEFGTAISTIGATQATLVIDVNTTVSTTVATPQTLSIDMVSPGKLLLNTGVTLTINGPFVAPNYKVIEGSGTGNVVFGAGSTRALVVQWWGALADGSTDDTGEIQAAIDSANNSKIKSVFFPQAGDYYEISAELTLYNNIEIYGEGTYSQIRQITANTNVVGATSKNEIYIHDLYFYGPGSADAAENGSGIYLLTCTKSKIKDCKFENMGNSGINFKSVDDSEIVNNLFVNASADLTNSSDIRIQYDSERNLIEGNHCVSGTKTGILIQSVDTGDNCNYNKIVNNEIKDTTRYGVVLYALGGASDSNVIGNAVTGNVVNNVSDSTATTFGACYYAVGTKYTKFIGNHAQNCNQGTTADTLAPGGFGVTNSEGVILQGNTVFSTSWYGITVRDPGGVGGFYDVIGNKVRGSTKNGIYALIVDNVNIIGNRVIKASSNGISSANTAAGDDNEWIDISNNILFSNASTGINVSATNRAIIHHNIARSNNTHGIAIAEGDTFTITDNIAFSNLADGFLLPSTATEIRFEGNNSQNNDKGVVSTTTSLYTENNYVYSNDTSDWSTGDAPFVALADSATPSVAFGNRFVTGGTTTITDFLGGTEDQVFILHAKHTTPITDGTNIFLENSTVYTMATTKTLTLQRRNGKWYEIGRGDN
jgi:parallel beta-helix repeat protein